jgi:hypothetical protein
MRRHVGTRGFQHAVGHSLHKNQQQQDKDGRQDREGERKRVSAAQQRVFADERDQLAATPPQLVPAGTAHAGGRRPCALQMTAGTVLTKCFMEWVRIGVDVRSHEIGNRWRPLSGCGRNLQASSRCV